MTRNNNGLLSPHVPILLPVKRICVLLLIVTAGSLFAESEMQGVASWYGGKFHGRLTSNGEIFDTNELTAAHKTLPFGTMVKVTNLDNGRWIVVRINDRGPFVEGRIIDLSRAAADALCMLSSGVARVTLEIISFATDKELFAIQIGAYGLEKNAERAQEKLESAGFAVTLERSTLGVVRVLIRGIATADLPGVRQRLESAGFTQYLVKKELTDAPQISRNTDEPAQAVVSTP
jgi:rare lipoprotein A